MSELHENNMRRKRGKDNPAGLHLVEKKSPITADALLPQVREQIANDFDRLRDYEVVRKKWSQYSIGVGLVWDAIWMERAWLRGPRNPSPAQQSTPSRKTASMVQQDRERRAA